LTLVVGVEIKLFDPGNHGNVGVNGQEEVRWSFAQYLSPGLELNPGGCVTATKV